jgi:hypothetical protein
MAKFILFRQMWYSGAANLFRERHACAAREERKVE